MEKACGGCDLADIRQEIAAALVDDGIKGIVLDIDSPGGTVTGVEETAGMIESARAVMPIIAHTSGMACSAAYWIGSAASALYVEPSAVVGSIGVYMAMLDTSRAMDAAGVKVDLIKSTDSPLKAAGFPGTSLTDAQRADLQAGVDHIYAKFSAAVSRNRPKAGRETMQGQTFFGDQAAANGLADSIASLDQTIRDVERLAN
jgi:signal peptide peptidase SppA